MSLEKARRRVALRLVGARFVRFAPVDAGQMEHEGATQAYEYGSYYAHRIGNQFLESTGHRFILSNGFLGSYAYNLALLFLLENRPTLDRALRHNLKKFFAECCLGTRNCLIGRALLIETLAYEQSDMRLLFERASASPALEEQARTLALFMSSLLNHHEMAHYFARRAAERWSDEVKGFLDGRLENWIDRWQFEHSTELADEMICDSVAVALALDGPGEVDADLSLLSRARMALFGYLCFGQLVSLQRSAQATAQSASAEDAHIDLGSEKRPKFGFTYMLGRDSEMDIRVREISALIESESQERHLELYGTSNGFPLRRDVASLLRSATENFLEVDDDPETPEGTSTNSVQRGLAQLLAESLHGHDRGADHLLWRSKTFSVGGESVDP